jgi:uncharacterized protein (DUF4415 family)
MRKKQNAGARPYSRKPSERAADPDEVPELTDDYFDRAAIYQGETLVRPARGRPKSAAAKQLTSLRLDPAVLAAFRASGPGWQTRVNAVLKAYAERKLMSASAPGLRKRKFSVG